MCIYPGCPTLRTIIAHYINVITLCTCSLDALTPLWSIQTVSDGTDVLFLQSEPL